MLEAGKFERFVSFLGVSFNINDIITLSLEFDEILEKRVLFIYVNGRHEPVVFYEKTDELFAFINQQIQSIDIGDMINSIVIQDSSEGGKHSENLDTVNSSELNKSLPKEPVIPAKIAPDLSPESDLEETDEELDRRLLGLP